MIPNKLRKAFLATASALTLTACGGGGGSGAVGTISEWVNNDLSTLSGSSSNIATWNNLINSFSSSIGNTGSIQSILSTPDANDKAQAQELLNLLEDANNAWLTSNNVINGSDSTLTDSEKYAEFNKDGYKKAYQAIEFLNNNIKPLLQKVANGQALTVAEFTSMDTKIEGDKIMNTYDANSYVNTKLVKSSTANNSTTETYNEVVDNGTAVVEAVSGGDGTWTIIEGKGGKEKRKMSTTTPQKRVVKNNVCTWTDVVKLTSTGSVTTKVNEQCNIKTTETNLDNKIENAWVERDGENPIATTTNLASTDSDPVTEWNSAYGTNGILTTTSTVGTVENTPEVVDGSETTSTQNIIKTRFITTSNPNAPIEVKDNYTKTTVVRPIVTTPSNNVTYKDIKTKQKRTYTITTLRKKVVYADGTDEIIETPQAKVYTDWTVVQISDNTRTVKEEGTPVDGFKTPLISEAFASEASRKTLAHAYTNDDSYLGIKTTNYNSDKTTYETDEYKMGVTRADGSFSKNGWRELSQINASSAYAKGWTGKGSTVAVADTGYDIDHSEFNGQISNTKDYTGTGINDSHGHGSHVLGTIVAKKDGTGMHGVAYDSKAIVIKIGNSHSVDLNNAATGFSWAADQGAVVGNLSANSNYDFIFRNSNNLVTLDDNTIKTTDSRYDYANKKFYNGQTAEPWKASTDKGLVIVNSAGNQGLDFAAHPGYFATATDSNGNLILGGKVLIVGAVDQSGNIASWSNRAGHLCVAIVDNKCTDPYKVSDFYVLAPGWSYSAKNDGTYGTMSGTSMAAPFVTGQVSILHQMWPHMKGENLVKLVTSTADKDSISGYNVNIHGQGLIDLDEATKPQGAIGIPTTGRADGATSNINGSYISGSSSAIASLSGINVMVLDEFDRDYYMNLGDSVVVQDKRKVSDIDVMMNGYTWMPINQMYGSFTQGGNYNLINNYNIGVYTGENGNGDFSANVGKNFFISDKFKLKTSIGQMNEQDAWLGNYSSGALAVGDNNTTNFGQFGIEYQLGNNVLSFDYSKGFTDINTVDESLIKSFKDVQTESYKLAYEVHKDKHNTFGWSFSLPSHITSGTMGLEVAESVNLDGTINYTDINSNLKQKIKEKNVGFFYNHTPENDMDATFNFTAEYREDIAGQDGSDGINLAFNYVKKLNTNCKFLWMKNPKCYEKDNNGKQVLKANLYGDSRNNNSIALTHGLVYDLKTDKFIPIKKK